MATYYDTAILPARPGKPRDKAKVEQSVLLADRWILARLRNARFLSLADLNAAISTLTAELNARLMRGFGASRAELFASLDAPALQPLRTPPYALIRQLLDVRIGEATLEVFHKSERVASHVRVLNRRGHTTIPEHMPSAHRRHPQWTPARLLEEAGRIGRSGPLSAVALGLPHLTLKRVPRAADLCRDKADRRPLRAV